MNIQPTSIERDGQQHLIIEWTGGKRRRYLLRQLRDHCPCATCREKRSSPQKSASMLPVLSTEEIQPLSIHSMQPVGAYAYKITFSDGHETGIYSYELLRILGEEVAG